MNSYGSLRLGCFQFLFGIFLCLNQLHSKLCACFNQRNLLKKNSEIISI